MFVSMDALVIVAMYVGAGLSESTTLQTAFRRPDCPLRCFRGCPYSFQADQCVAVGVAVGALGMSALA